MADTPLNITKEWRNYWAEAGAVIQLSYLTPDRRDCYNDKQAYALLVAPEGVAQLSAAVRLDLIGKNSPSKGYERISDPPTGKGVWSAWVVITKAGRLGDVIQENLNPCNSSKALYSLAAVSRITQVGAIATLAAKANDKYEAIAGKPDGTLSDFFSPAENVKSAQNAVSTAADKAKETAKDVAKTTANTLGDILQPLLLPAVIAIGVYLLVTQKKGAAA